MELSMLNVIGVMLIIAAFAGIVNEKVFKQSNTVGSMIATACFSVVLLALENMKIVDIRGFEHILERIQFDQLLIHYLLPPLLFAGALHVTYSSLRSVKYAFITYATLGVIFSTIICGMIVFLAADMIGIKISFMQSLVFGVLISSTDPVCALGILNRGGVNPSFRAKITGESLGNDGTSIVLYMTLVTAAFGDYVSKDLLASDQIQAAAMNMNYSLMAKNLVFEVIGGVLVGLVTAFIASWMTKHTKSYETQLLITLALVFFGYGFSETAHVSAPIMVVVAGLYIGNRTFKKFMSEENHKQVNEFWHLFDTILNSILFVLMGLTLVLVDLTWTMFAMGVAAIVAMMVARYFAIILCNVILLPVEEDKETLFTTAPLVMTWGGLRGGISIALALSIPNSQPEVRDLILSMTFMCVFFSVVVQGTTLAKVLVWLKAANIESPEAIAHHEAHKHDKEH